MEENIKFLGISEDKETGVISINIAVKIINPKPRFVVKFKAEDVGMSEEEFVEAVNEFEKTYPELVKFTESK